MRLTCKGVFGGPSGPSREGLGVGHKIVSDRKTDDIKEKNNEEKCVKKKNGRKRERKMDRNKREGIKKCSKTRTETEILTC